MVRSLVNSGYQQANGLLDPYQVLCLFCDALTKNQLNNSNLSQQNMQIKSKNIQLESTCKSITLDKQELQARIKGLQLEYAKIEANYTIKMIALQQKMQQLKTARQKSIAEIENLKRKNQTVVAELIAENRQKFHDLVSSHKYEMIQYRKTVEEDAWKMQSCLRGQIDGKNEQIKKLVISIDRLKKADKVYEKDWIVLQNLLKPYKQHSALIQKLAQLRKQISAVKADNRSYMNKSLQLQIQNSGLKNQYQKKQQQLRILEENIQNLEDERSKNKQQLQKQIQDKERLTKYYDQKWVQQFNQVKINLEKKVTQKTQHCQREYNEKKKQVQQQNSVITQQNKRLKQQVQQMQDRLLQNQKKMEAQVKVRFNLIDKISELKKNIRSSQCMFHQDLAAHIIREKKEIEFLQCQIQDLQYKIKRIEQYNAVQLAQKDSQFKTAIFQLKKQQFEKRKNLQKLLESLNQQKFQKQVQIKQCQFDQKKLNEKIRIQYEMKLDKKLQLERQRCRQQIEEKGRENRETEVKLLGKIKENEKRWRQEQHQKQELKQHFQNQLQNLKNVINNHDRQTEALKYQLNRTEYYKQQHKMQIDSWRNKLYDCQVQIKSMALMVESKQATIYSLNLQLKQIVRQKLKWGKLLKNTKIQFEQGFKDMKQNCDKLIAFYKGRIWEMERMLQHTPISQKDYTKIKNLSEQNKKLGDKIQIKQAQNLILQQIKQYYESKVLEHQFQKDIHFQAKNKSVFVKRPKKRQGLISLKQTAAQRSSIFDTKQVSDLRRYIKKKQRQNISHRNQRPFSFTKQQYNSRQRNKSSMV